MPEDDGSLFRSTTTIAPILVATRHGSTHCHCCCQWWFRGLQLRIPAESLNAALSRSDSSKLQKQDANVTIVCSAKHSIKRIVSCTILKGSARRCVSRCHCSSFQQMLILYILALLCNRTLLPKRLKQSMQTLQNTNAFHL